VKVGGTVQGVGFRPFVFRLAAELNLVGWVNNSPQGVVIEVEGPRDALEQFFLRLESKKPLHSSGMTIRRTTFAPYCARYCLRTPRKNISIEEIIMTSTTCQRNRKERHHARII